MFDRRFSMQKNTKGAIHMMRKMVASGRKGGGIKYILILSAITAAMVISIAAPAFASSVITGKINNLYSLVLGIIKAAGAIVLAWGVFEFAAGYQSHDSAQQTQSLKKVISGILMCGASTVISLVK